MRSKRLFLFVFFALVPFTYAGPLKAESELESKFQDMFVTAGYSAAAGAAIGAALITFKDEPTKHLNFISMGASIGFLSGATIGGWLMIAPVFVENSAPISNRLAVNQSANAVVVRPWINVTSKQLIGLEAGAVLANF